MPTIPQLLDFAHRHPNIRGNVEERIRTELGVTPARYCVLLHRAAASLEGQACDPITAHRVLNARWSCFGSSATLAATPSICRSVTKKAPPQ